MIDRPLQEKKVVEKKNKFNALHIRKGVQEKNIATGETSQAITPFHFFDNLNFHR